MINSIISYFFHGYSENRVATKIDKIFENDTLYEIKKIDSLFGRTYEFSKKSVNNEYTTNKRRYTINELIGGIELYSKRNPSLTIEQKNFLSKIITELSDQLCNKSSKLNWFYSTCTLRFSRLSNISKDILDKPNKTSREKPPPIYKLPIGKNF